MAVESALEFLYKVKEVYGEELQGRKVTLHGQFLLNLRP